MALTLLAAVALSNQMYGGPNDKIRHEIQETYDGYAASVLRHDLDGTMGYLTPDIVWVYPNGKEERTSEIRKGMKQWQDSIKPGTKMSFTIDKLKIDSNEQLQAFVTMHYLTSEMATSKKPEATSRWHDTWVKSHGRWKNSRGVALAPDKK